MTILERDAQLDEISALVEQASDGGKVVLVRGGAGIGKTTFVHALVERHRDQVHVLTGVCDDLSTPQPLGPIWDMAVDEPTLDGLLREGDRRKIFAELLDLLSRSLRPTLMVIEDTHWSDAATLDAIKFLGRRIRKANGVLVLTFRDSEEELVGSLRSVVGELAAEDLARVRLVPLSEEAVGELLEGSDLDAAEVFGITGGNPFYVTEVLGEGVGSIPPSVQDHVIARVARLDPATRTLVQFTSVVPGGVEWDVAKSAGVVDSASVSAAERAGLLVVGTDVIAFKHELARQAVEDDLTPSERMDLNGLVLGAMSNDSKAARHVHHAAEAGDTHAIVMNAPRAAADAVAVGSHREAAAQFRRLEPHLETFSHTERAHILADWAREEWLLDRNRQAHELVNQALLLRDQVDDAVWLSETLFLASAIAWALGNRQEAVGAIDDAIAFLADSPQQRRFAYAISKRGQLAMLANQFESAIEISDRALELAESLDDGRTTAHSLINKGAAVTETDFDLGLELLRAGQSLAVEQGMHYEEVRAAINGAFLLCSARRLSLADVWWREGLNLAFRNEIPALERYAEAIGAWCLEQQGDWVAAEDLARKLIASDLRSVPTDIVALGVLGTIEARRDRPEARSTLIEAWQLAAESEEVQRMAPVAAALAEFVYLSREFDEDLLAIVTDVLDLSRGTRAWFTGPIRYWLWRIDRDPEDHAVPDPLRLSLDKNVDAAAAAWAQIGSPYAQADALAQGDASQRLEALRVFEDLGANAAARIVKQDLREAGVPIPRGRGVSTRIHEAGLTPRQAEVLALLAQGLSNTDIADQLFLSQRTVEHHVSAVISKLEVTTRTEAVDEAVRRGVLDEL